MIRQLVVNEIRNRRVLVVLWLAALGLGLVVNLTVEPWIPVFRGSSLSATGIVGWVWVGVAVLLASILVVSCVSEHAPAKRGHVLAARPIRLRTLWGAKALFLLLAVVAPVVVQDVVYLVLGGQCPRVVSLGALQTALWVAAAVAMAAGFAALWESRGRMAVALVLAGAAVGGAAYLKARFSGGSAFGGLGFESPLTYVCAMALAAAGFAGLAAVRPVVRARFAVKLPAAVLVALGAWAFLAWGPVVEAPVKPDGLPSGTAARGELADTGAAYRIVREEKPGDAPLLCLSLRPDRVSGLVPNQGVLWQAKKIEWGGHSKNFRLRPPLDLMGRRKLSRRKTEPLVWTVANYLETRPDWENISFPGNDVPEEVAISVEAEPERPVDVSTTLDGTVYEWEVAADLPMKEGVVVRERGREWRVRLVEYGKFRRFLVRIDTRGAELWCSTRQEDRESAEGGWFLRTCLVVYDPNRNRARIANRWFARIPSRAAGSGYVCRSFIAGVVPRPGSVRAPDEKPLRLIVLRLRYLGRIEREWHAPFPVRLDMVPKKMKGTGAPPLERIGRSEFDRWFSQRKQPPLDTPDDEVRRVVFDVLGRIRERRWGVHMDLDRIREVLARYVPRHLDVFVDAARSVSGKDSGASVFVNSILIEGAEASQAGALAKALPDAPELLEVFEARGWERQALPVLHQRFRAGSFDFHEAVLLSRFGQLSPYAPLMIAEFRRRPYPWDYRKLRRLPEVGKGVEEAVREIWARRDGSAINRYTLELALEQGLPGAVAVLRTRLESMSKTADGVNSDWEDLVANHFQCDETAPKGVERRHFLLDWFLAHRPEDFRFDPVLRKFVLVPKKQRDRKKQ